MTWAYLVTQENKNFKPKKKTNSPLFLQCKHSDVIAVKQGEEEKIMGKGGKKIKTKIKKL